MQHLEAGYLHAIADGEVPSDELVAVRDHLDVCESCRTRLEEAKLEAESARELIELIEVPVGPSLRRSVGPTQTRTGGRWVRALAWAASLVLAAGIGYMSRNDMTSTLSPQLEPTSLGRIDTVFLEVPAREAEAVPSELNRQPAANTESPPPRPASVPAAPPAPERKNEAGARQEASRSVQPQRKLSFDSTLRLDEVVVTAQAEKKSLDTKEEDAQARQAALRDRAAADARDQLSLRASRAAPTQPAAPSAGEGRSMAKAAADAAMVVVTFPRAVELLGGRIKLIEGMVPVRLEAVGRMVRVVYLIDEGDLVLSQVSVPDSLNWSLSGPLPADSLERLRQRVK